MAVPTITSVSPASGPAGGRSLVIITGTNFRLAPAPPAVGETDEVLSPTVRVTVGGEEALAVDVTGTDQLRVLVPAYRGDVQADPIVAVAVVVTNLDDLGVAIPGETVTLAASFTYQRSALRAPRATGDTQRYDDVVRNVLRLFRRQLHPNTELADASVDFGETSISVVYTAEMPNVVIEGPRFIRDPVRVTNESRMAFNGATGRFDLYRPQIVRTLAFELRCTTNNKLEGAAFQQAIEELFARNGYLYVDDVPSTPSQGRVRFPLCLTAEPAFVPVGAGADLHIVKAGFEVRGCNLELQEPYESVESVDTVELEAQQDPTSPGTEIVRF